MRDAFHEDLDKISDQLVTMTTMVATALERATAALLEGDRTVAESVIAADDDIDTLRREIDDLAVDLLHRFSPRPLPRPYALRVSSTSSSSPH